MRASNEMGIGKISEKNSNFREVIGCISDSIEHGHIATMEDSLQKFSWASIGTDFNPSINQSINQIRIRVTKVTNVTVRPPLQC